MASAGVVATSGRVFRMASKTPDKFGARSGFFSDGLNNHIQSNTPSDDNGATKLGNLSNPFIEVNDVQYLIAGFSQFATTQSLSVVDANGDLDKSDITSIKTHLGTLLTSESYCNFINNANGGNNSVWSFLYYFNQATNPPIIIDTLNTSSTSSFTYLDIT